MSSKNKNRIGSILNSKSQFLLGNVFLLLGLGTVCLAVPDKGVSGGYGGGGGGQTQPSLVYKSAPLQKDNGGGASLSFGGVGHNNNGHQDSEAAAGNGNSYAQTSSQDLYQQSNVNQGKELPSYVSAQSGSFGPSGGYALGQGPVDSYGPPSPSTGVHGGNFPPNNNHQQPDGQSYTYYYQHYPATHQGKPAGHGQGQGQGSHNQILGHGGFSQGVGQGWSSGEEGGGSFFDSFGGDAGGAGIAGLGGLGGLAGIAAVAKGILALKPFLIAGALLLLSVPLVLLFLPIPILSISDLANAAGGPQPAPAGGGGGDGTKVRQFHGQNGHFGGPSVIGSYISQFSDRILNADECLERIICKLPQVSGSPDFQTKAKFYWEKYGKKYFKNSVRVQRGIDAYLGVGSGPGSSGSGSGAGGSSARSRAAKCNQKFKCSNNLF